MQQGNKPRSKKRSKQTSRDNIDNMGNCSSSDTSDRLHIVVKYCGGWGESSSSSWSVNRSVLWVLHIAWLKQVTARISLISGLIWNNSPLRTKLWWKENETRLPLGDLKCTLKKRPNWFIQRVREWGGRTGPKRDRRFRKRLSKLWWFGRRSEHFR